MRLMPCFTRPEATCLVFRKPLSQPRFAALCALPSVVNQRSHGGTCEALALCVPLLKDIGSLVFSKIWYFGVS